jgi:hypothetical protein
MEVAKMTTWTLNTFLMSAVSASALSLALSAGAMAHNGKKPDSDDQVTLRLISPYYGDINPFYGDINPFYGDINPFYGDISPFWGDISPFWGDISPFYGDIDAFWGDIDAFYGDIDAFYGDIGAFWGDIGPFWGDIDAFWGDIGAFNDSEYGTLLTDLNALFDRAEDIFGPAYQGVTGTDFESGFQAELTARFGIDLNDARSLEDISAEDRARFFLEFYDGLMRYSGRDHVDHWMPAINWTPRLSHEAGAGAHVRVGLVDFSVPYRMSGLTGRNNGKDYLNFNHGLGVASLIGADHDGEGLMGVAPDVLLTLSNPFDESLSTNWTDVRSSVRRQVMTSHIMNLSLGMPGWTFNEGWADVLSDRFVSRFADNTLFVFAAGNDGVSQTIDVNWTDVRAVENLLIVGSVSPTGEISNFSNRPGDACFTVRNQCAEGARLMDRFLVAPGEMILMPDGEGGYVRLSGTSFAAPLVTGAAALVKGEWRWLGAGDIAEVLLSTTQDLGAPGVDPVYGRGLLDVQAAMGPINRDDLYTYTWRGQRVSASEFGFLKSRFNLTDQSSITVFEDLRDTFRDFEMTLAELSLGEEVVSASAAAANQSYVFERVGQPVGVDFRQGPARSYVVDQRNGLVVSAFASSLDAGQAWADGDLPFQAGMALENTEAGYLVRFGVGEGALAFSEDSGFGLTSDFRPETGGVNPLLGYASGGPFAMAGFDMGTDTRLSIAASTTRDSYTFSNPLTGERTAIFETLDAYAASALALDLRHQLNAVTSLQAGYTHLSEEAALLGGQGLGVLAFDGGSETDALTFGADMRLGDSMQLSVSGAVARTAATAYGDAGMALSDPALSTAFQVSLSRNNILRRGDAVRASFIQPLHVESGVVEYSGLAVTDAETGTLGVQTQRWRLGGDRPLAMEMLYGMDAFDGRLSLNAFGRVEGPNADFQAPGANWAGGMRARLRF